MSKKQMVVLGASFWAVGFASAGALAYAVNRPLTAAPLPSDESASAVAVLAPPSPEPVAPKPAEPIVIRLEPTVIVAHLAKLAQAKPVDDSPRTLSEMHCANWRPLEQGYDAVRVCD